MCLFAVIYMKCNNRESSHEMKEEEKKPGIFLQFISIDMKMVVIHRF